MVDLVPRSDNLMELAGLLSGEAKGLFGRVVGSLHFKGAPTVPCPENECPSRVLGLGFLAPGVRVHGLFVSRDPVLHRAPQALESQKIHQGTISRFRSPSASKVVATGSETDFRLS